MKPVANNAKWFWVLISAVMVGTLGACGSTAATEASAQGSETTTPSSTQPSRESGAVSDGSFEVPEAFGTVDRIAADSATSGVWVWDATDPGDDAAAKEARIWHVVTGEPSQSWSLGSDASVAVPNSAGPALAACGDHAWLGINDLLVGIDSTQGTIRRFTVPDAASHASVDARTPAGIDGSSSIQTVGCGGGVVVVGRRSAASAFALDVSTGTFRSVALPSDHDAVSAAVAANGIVAFGLQSWKGAGPHQVLLWDPSSGESRVVEVRNSASVRVRSGESGAVFETGETGQEVRVAEGLSKVTLSTGNSSMARSDVDPSTRNIGLTPDGLTVVASAKGLLMETPEGDPKTMPLGTRACVEPSGPMGPEGPAGAGESADRSTRCPVQAAGLAVDGDGTIWYAPVNSHQVRSLSAPEAT